MNLLNNIEIIEKKSKFYGYLYECKNEKDVKDALMFLQSEHKKATHICYACRLKSPFYEKAVDDGEPSGTAGRPILSVLQKKDVSDVCAFVVRYFGGVKLGAGGLVRIYAKVTSELFKSEN